MLFRHSGQRHLANPLARARRQQAPPQVERPRRRDIVVNRVEELRVVARPRQVLAQRPLSGRLQPSKTVRVGIRRVDAEAALHRYPGFVRQHPAVYRFSGSRRQDCFGAGGMAEGQRGTRASPRAGQPDRDRLAPRGLPASGSAKDRGRTSARGNIRKKSARSCRHRPAPCRPRMARRDR